MTNVAEAAGKNFRNYAKY